VIQRLIGKKYRKIKKRIIPPNTMMSIAAPPNSSMGLF
jgi:hypothetical protein